MPDTPCMTAKRNPLTGDWLCQLDGCPAVAYYVSGARAAQDFCDRVNADLLNGRLYVCSGALHRAKEAPHV